VISLLISDCVDEDDGNNPVVMAAVAVSLLIVSLQSITVTSAGLMMNSEANICRLTATEPVTGLWCLHC